MYNILTKENFHEAMMHLKLSNSLYVTFGEKNIQDTINEITDMMNTLYPESNTSIVFNRHGVYVARYTADYFPIGSTVEAATNFILKRYKILSDKFMVVG